MVDARTTSGAHEAEVARLREAYAALPPGAPVRLAKRTSNLFRFRDAGPRESPKKAARTRTAGLDVSAFGHVLCVDPVARTARVGGMTTYEDLCDATLPHQLMPLVVPQLKTITLGGAVTGLGIESTSLRNGMPHESVTEMEILTGDGRVVRATDDNEHADLFRGFPNSYGTLGYGCRSPSSSSRSGPTCTCATSRSAAPKPAWRPSARSPRRAATAATGRTSSTGPRSRPTSSTSPSARSATWRRGAATTPASRSTTSRSGGTRRTSSPSATTCGAGTPTGSGARGPSACRSRWSGGCGRAVTGARTCTASWSPWTAATA